MSLSTDSAVSSNIYRIEPLRGAENYSVWKIKMTDILTELFYYNIATGASKKPEARLSGPGVPGTTDAETEKEIAIWEKKNRSALSAIQLHVADKMLVYIASSNSSYEAWKALKEVLEPQ